MKAIASVFMLVVIFTKGYAQGPDSIPAQIKKSPWFVERFRITAGLFIPVTNTDLQVGIKGISPGTPVNLQKDLGFSNSQLTFLASFQWRMARRSRLSVSYYNIPQKSSHILKDDIIFKDDTFHVNTSVNSYFSTTIYQISFGYAILAKPKFELGIQIGTHLVDAKTGISQNGTNSSNSKSTEFGITAPLPDLGIWGGYMFNKRFSTNFNVNYLSLTIGNIAGRILGYNLVFSYRMLEKLDLALGFSGLNFKLDKTLTYYKGHFNWVYYGPYLGVTYSFGNKSW